jgi:hypothetical protein
MASAPDRTGALEAIDRILNRGGDADDVLRDVLAVLGRLYPYVALAFAEGDSFVTGPEVGSATPGSQHALPVSFQDTKVAELRIAGADSGDSPLLERVATLISAHCLVGWDTGGEAWEP